jgi:hypothetical protein
MRDPLRRAVAAEAAMWRSLLHLVRRRPPEPGEAFGYLGVVKPILGVFIGLSVVEIPVLDLIVRHVVPWRPARWIMLALSVWGLLWMIGMLAGLKAHPHVIGDAGIRVRMGVGVDLLIPWESVESVTKRYRSMPSSRSVQIEDDGGRRVLHVVVGSQTSVDVRLRAPASFTVPKGPTGPVDEVRLYADDPDLLVRATRVAL